MRTGEVKVWDPLIRVFHWGLAASFLVAYLTQEAEYDLHLISGYCLLGLLAFRLIWGLAGARHARFSDFVYRPSHVLDYLRSIWDGQPSRYLGHNPAGGVMILILLTTLLLVALSGVALDAAENRAGPLGGTRLFLFGDLVKEVHLVSTDVAVVLIGLHLVGVLHAGLVHGENLVAAMITGRKRAD